MANRQKVARLLAPIVPLKLAVEGEGSPHVLELDLSWTLRGVIALEAKLRSFDIHVNVLQNPRQFWSDMDVSSLGIGIWAMSQQNHPEYADEQGLETILSFITPQNYQSAIGALKECYVESLSKDKREQIRQAEKEAEMLLASGQEPKESLQDPMTAQP